jgi:hypothetical protein
MKTRHPIASLVVPRASVLVLVLAACTHGDDPAPVEPEPLPASAAAVRSTAAPPSIATPIVTPEPAPPPEPEPPPPANAEPAELRLSAYGRCKYLGVSTVDDQTFLHYRFGEAKGFVHRMDPRGGVAETLRFDEGFHWDDTDPPPWKQQYTEIRKLTGHWPDQLVLLAVHEYRDSDEGHLYRRVGDGWQRIETLGRNARYEDAWPWHDRSILAWVGDVENGEAVEPRLAVVRGEGKGPSLSRVRKRSRCEDYDFSVRDVHVQANGKVSALVHCGGTWIATWTPDDLAGTVQRVGPDDWSWLHLDAHGQGHVLVGSSLIAWDGTTATPVKAPGKGKVEKVFVGRDGEAWILQGRKLSRRTAEGWEPVAVPDGSPVTHVAGLEHGTPWLLRKDGTVSMQTADGAWHAIPLPPTPDLGKVPKATTIHVLAPGDVWIEGTYFKMNKGSKHVGKPFWAAFTTRDAPTSFECGKEPGVEATAHATTDPAATAQEQPSP